MDEPQKRPRRTEREKELAAKLRRFREKLEKAEEKIEVAESERDQANSEAWERVYDLETRRLSTLGRLHRLINLSVDRDDSVRATLEAIEQAMRNLVSKDH